tara:strand:- start:99 stop:689 length:591 start_codon:yes stop_codon:yes gene_type:complete
LFIQTHNYLFFIFAYLIGSIPFGLILSKLTNNADPRLHGSNNIGATNIARLSGYKIGLLTLSLDILKTTLTIKLCQYFIPEQIMHVAFLVFLGHIYPVWLIFKGGKGVAVFLGILFCFSSTLSLIFIFVWIFIFIIFRYSSLSALSACTSTLITSFFLFDNSIILFITALNLIIFIKHSENIRRLINGEEKKFLKK